MKHRFLSALLAAAMALTTTVPAVSAAERSAAADNPAAEQFHTIPTMETPLAMANPTAKEAYNIMIAMKADYPEGMPFTNDNYYGWKGGIYGGGYGCAAFAFMLSDAVFGTAKAKRTTEFVSNNVRVGDILRNNSHSYIVLEVKSNSFIIAEANFNGTVHWEREITFKEVSNNFEEHLTRYDDASETTPTTTTTQKATTTTKPTTTTTTTKPTTTTTSTEMTQGAELEITQQPIKRLYALANTGFIEKTELDVTGLRVSVRDDDGEMLHENVNPLDYPEYFEISGFDPEFVGEQQIVVTYQAFNHEKNEDIIATASFIVELIDLTTEENSRDRYIIDMELLAVPDKTEYTVGEKLDLTGILVKAECKERYVKTGAEADAKKLGMFSEFSVAGYDPNKVGEQEVLVIYEKFNSDFNEDVRAAVSFKVDVKAEETTVTTTTTASTTTTTASTTTTTTTSTEMTQGARMEIAVMPVKTLYADYTYNESDGWQLDATGLRVNVWHESENGEELVYEEFNPLLDPAHFSITGLDKNVYGKQNITVTYHDFNHEKNEDIIATASFIVELIDLNAEPERCVFEMKLNRLPDKLTYRMDEPLDLSGIFGEVRIFDSEQIVITEFDAEEIRYVERYVLSDYNPSVPGEQEITVIYQFFNAEKNEDVRCAAAFTVTVLDAFGDVNCDKNADASDAAQILVASAAVGAGGASGLTAEQERDIDVDRDGDFDAADAAIILTYAAYSGTGGTMTLREYLNQ